MHYYYLKFIKFTQDAVAVASEMLLRLTFKLSDYKQIKVRKAIDATNAKCDATVVRAKQRVIAAAEYVMTLEKEVAKVGDKAVNKASSKVFKLLQL